MGAAVSAMGNIAEGFSRSSNKEFTQLSLAEGSLTLCVKKRRKTLPPEIVG
jgi:four helix bundle protein